MQNKPSVRPLTPRERRERRERGEAAIRRYLRGIDAERGRDVAQEAVRAHEALREASRVAKRGS